MWLPLGFVIAGYLTGSVCFGLVIAKRRGVDLRTVGSGNVGATNVGRALGRSTARVVLVLDAAKATVPVGLATWSLGRLDPWVAATACAAVVGHCYPLYFGFRGGKGVATAAGALVVLGPLALAGGAGAFGALRALTGRTSIGSLVGAVVALVLVTALDGNTPPSWGFAAIVMLLVWRHRDNIRRLRRGEELSP